MGRVRPAGGARGRWRRSGARTVLLLAALLATACEPAERVTFSPPQRAGTLGVAGADLFYQVIGTGEPILVIHGGPGLDHSYLRPWLDPLGETHRVILYDQRGLGRSAARIDTASITMSRFLTDIDRLRESVAERERVTLLAHSWGAIPALLYALEAPERVASLILVSPVEPGSRFAAATEAARAARTDSADRRAMDSIAASEAFRTGDAEALNRLFFHAFRGTFAEPARADSLLALDLEPRTARQGRRVAALLMTPLRGMDLWDDLGGIEAPVLLLHGARDPIPLEMVQALDEALSDSRLVVLEGAGHFPFIETPGPFFGAVGRFLDEAAAGTP